MFGKIPDAEDGGTIDFSWRILGVGIGECGDLCRAVRPFHDEGFADFQVVAVFGVNIVHQLGQRLADGFRVGGDFRKHQGGTIRIFITDGVGAEVTVAFLAAEDEEAGILQPQRAGLGLSERAVVASLVGGDCVFILPEFSGDVFETGERVDDAHAEAIGDGVLEFSRDEGFYEHRAVAVRVGEPAELETGFQAIPGHQ